MNSLGIWIFVLFAAGQLNGIHANNTNANTVLNYINSKRRLHGCPPLILSDALSSNCTKHAESMSLLGSVSHSKSIDNSYTENICTFGNEADALRLCVEEWYYGAQYDILDAQAAEFTAMIWRSSKLMGYGEAMLDSTDTLMVVRFVPGGNALGQYKYNMPPLLEKFEMDWRRFATHYYIDQHSVIYSTCSKKEKKKKKKKKKRKNFAIHQANQAPLCMLTILTISYWLRFFLN